MPPAESTVVAARRDLAAVALAGVLWGSIGVVVRILQDDGQSTGSIAFWRFGLSCVVLVPVLGRTGFGALRTNLARPGLLLAVSVASLGFQTLFFLAVHDVGVAAATLVTLGLAPALLIVVQALRSRRRPAARTVVVLAVALTGLALVAAAGHGSGQSGAHPGRGLLEAAASAACFAAGTAWSGTLATRVHPLAVTFVSSLVGFVVLLPVVAATAWQVPATWPHLAGIAWLAVVATVVAYGLFYAGLRTVPGHVALVLTLLEAATAVVLAAAVLGEPLTVGNVLGGVLLLAAVVALYADPRNRDGASALPG